VTRRAILLKRTAKKFKHPRAFKSQIP